MKSGLSKLNYSNVIATMALFIALGGAAVAAGLPKHSVGPRQLKRGAVTTAALRKAAVRSGKLAPKAVVAGKLGPSSVLPGNIVNGGITTAKIGNGAVIARSIKNNVVTTNKLNNNAVTTQKLANDSVTTSNLVNGSVTPNKLSNEFGPIVATLKSGQTLRGTFNLGGGGIKTEPKDEAQGAISYQFPLQSAPTSTVLQMDQTSASCAGIGADNQTPQATPGHVCIYVRGSHNINPAADPLTTLNDSRIGLGLALQANQAGEAFAAYGLWAVTAP